MYIVCDVLSVRLLETKPASPHMVSQTSDHYEHMYVVMFWNVLSVGSPQLIHIFVFISM